MAEAQQTLLSSLGRNWGVSQWAIKRMLERILNKQHSTTLFGFMGKTDMMASFELLGAQNYELSVLIMNIPTLQHVSYYMPL